jgi:hypothetical protein
MSRRVDRARRGKQDSCQDGRGHWTEHHQGAIACVSISSIVNDQYNRLSCQRRISSDIGGTSIHQQRDVQPRHACLVPSIGLSVGATNSQVLQALCERHTPRSTCLPIALGAPTRTSHPEVITGTITLLFVAYHPHEDQTRRT